MAGFGNTFRQALNNLIFKNTAFTSPGGVIYVGLHTADPGPDGQTANEVSGNGYARKVTAATDWNTGTLADPSVVTNANAITFNQASGGNWGTITHGSLWRTLSGTTAADFIGASALASSQVVNDTNTLSIPAGSLSHSFDSV